MAFPRLACMLVRIFVLRVSGSQFWCGFRRALDFVLV